ncbi:MAG: 16S rRNA (adenine(1518)-N(6)/adenine(1519)-N(6))-dimethyltransferase RsmA [Gammaproteobacteria bacterium]|nr:16S rRNA (adenine(1518)-N(6)/adenine(1519)-N(6))-dimethyltransferase RsmA [Gammaproteobacteria bacterium]
MKHKPRKRFGQNFLHDAGIIHQIVFAISPQPNENIVEIGPGKGALTGPILEQTGTINVVELDRDLIPLLQENLHGKGELTVHSADALKFDFAQLSDDKNDLRIIGNLPYNISTPLLFHLTSFLPHIKDMHFMLQKEVVDRIVAEPNTKAYGRLGVMLQYYCNVEKLFIVKPGAFFPPPKVDSAIVRLIPREKPPVDVKDEKVFSKVVTQCFAMRRKTLRNNLKDTLSSEEIESVGIDPGCRAETLTINEFAALGNLVAEKG